MINRSRSVRGRSLLLIFFSTVMIAAPAASAANQEGKASDTQPKTPQPQRVLKFNFIPEFRLHFSITPAIATEMAQALDLLGREGEVRAALADAAKQLDELEREAKERRGKAGESEGNELYREWYEQYRGISQHTEPERFEEAQRAKDALGARLDELKIPIYQETRQILLEAEAIIESTTTNLAELSPLSVEVSQARARLVILRQAFMRFPNDARFGDFQRPIDVRDFILFVARCSQPLATEFGLEDDPAAYAAPAGSLGQVLDEYDRAQLSYLNDRLARRRDWRTKDRVLTERDVAQEWTKAYELPRATVDRIGTVLAEESAALATEWRTLFAEYFCPELTGLWSADVVIEMVKANEEAVPPETMAAIDELAEQYELERRRLVEEAITVGIAVTRKHGGTKPGIGDEENPEQRRFREKCAQLEALSQRTVDAVVNLVESDPTLVDVSAVIKDAQKRGPGPFVRPRVKAHAGHL